LIIYGWRAFYRTIDHGMFRCRKCDADRQYRHRRGRRWVTLFFIPVIPLNPAGEDIHCTTCRTRSGTGAASQPAVG
jgi:hypothetical protein